MPTFPIPTPFPEQVKYTIEDDPNYPYITLILAPSQLLGLVELAHIMANTTTDYDEATAQVKRAMTLIKWVCNRDQGIASMIPDDVWDMGQS